MLLKVIGEVFIKNERVKDITKDLKKTLSLVTCFWRPSYNGYYSGLWWQKARFFLSCNKLQISGDGGSIPPGCPFHFFMKSVIYFKFSEEGDCLL